jgi:hypothetical protein
MHQLRCQVIQRPRGITGPQAIAVGESVVAALHSGRIQIADAGLRRALPRQSRINLQQVGALWRGRE